MNNLLIESFKFRYKNIQENGTSYKISDFILNNPHVQVLHLLIHDLNILRTYSNVHNIEINSLISMMKKATVSLFYVLHKNKEKISYDVVQENFEGSIFELGNIEKLYTDELIDIILIQIHSYFGNNKKTAYVSDKVLSDKPHVCIMF